MQKFCCARRASALVNSRKCRAKPKFQSRRNYAPNYRALPRLGVKAALDGHADEVEIALDQIRPADQITLHLLAGLPRQEGTLRLRLNTLGDDWNLQGMCKAQDRAA